MPFYNALISEKRPVKYTASGITAMIAAASARSNQTTVVGSSSGIRRAQSIAQLAPTMISKQSATSAGWTLGVRAMATALPMSAANAVSYTHLTLPTKA